MDHYQEKENYEQMKLDEEKLNFFRGLGGATPEEKMQNWMHQKYPGLFASK